MAVLGASAAAVWKLRRGREVQLSRLFTVEKMDGRNAPELDAERAGAAVSVPDAPGKVVLLHFWASWCSPCRAELPGLLALAEELRGEGGFELYAVSVDESWAEVASMFDDGKIPAGVVRGNRLEVARQYGVQAIPDSFLLDREGRVIERYPAARDWQTGDAEKHLRQVIGAR
jgi:thiol-disulfide isomerase/thioredoxin